MHPIEWTSQPRFDVTGTVLMASVEVPATLRPPASDGSTRVDVEIHGADPASRLDATRNDISRVIDELPELTRTAHTLAPREWQMQHQPRRVRTDSALWLTGLEFYDDGRAILLFDFGDLDLLALELRPDHAPRVTLEP